MATIYEVKLHFVSAFVAYNEEQIENLLKEFIKTYRDPITGLGFESVSIGVERK